MLTISSELMKGFVVKKCIGFAEEVGAAVGRKKSD